MSADPRKPPVLYHGTAEKLSRIEPRPAHGVGPEHDKLEAVYATHLRNLAIAFSLPITPVEGGGFSFGVAIPEELDEDAEPRIDLHVGSIDMSRQGYVYVVPSDTFEQMDPWQWASHEPVQPLNIIQIDPSKYIHWVQYEDPGGS